MAGLLAANLLRHRDPLVVEAQGELPNNHSAVLRFRTPTVGEALGIQFRRVNLVKAVIPWRNPVADAMAYSMKVLGKYRSDRSLSMPAGTSSSERWIAPRDLVERMASRLRPDQIQFGKAWNFDVKFMGKPISTIPMPVLMTALGYHGRRPDFSYRHGVNVVARVANCDAFVSVYVPNPDQVFSRVSITGDELIVEVPGYDRTILEKTNINTLVVDALKLLGVGWSDVSDIEVKEQRYAKIEEIDDQERRAFIFWASSHTGQAFSLGRFATWRPHLLLDDLLRDIRLIDGWIGSSTPGYDMDIHHVEGRK